MADQSELIKMLQQQQKAILEQQRQQTKVIELLTSHFGSGNVTSNEQLSITKLKESLAASIQEFIYDAENGITFTSWYRRYEDVFLVDGASLDEQAKVRLLMQKLGPAEHTVLQLHPATASSRFSAQGNSI